MEVVTPEEEPVKPVTDNDVVTVKVKHGDFLADKKYLQGCKLKMRFADAKPAIEAGTLELVLSWPT